MVFTTRAPFQTTKASQAWLGVRAALVVLGPLPHASEGSKGTKHTLKHSSHSTQTAAHPVSCLEEDPHKHQEHIGSTSKYIQHAHGMDVCRQATPKRMGEGKYCHPGKAKGGSPLATAVAGAPKFRPRPQHLRPHAAKAIETRQSSNLKKPQCKECKGGSAEDSETGKRDSGNWKARIRAPQSFLKRP